MNTLNTSEVEAIERNIKKAKEFVSMGAALERLSKNVDFRKVIKEGYFEQEAIRLVHLKSDVSMQSDASQKTILAQIDAIGTLAAYFQTIAFTNDQAQKAIDQDEAMIEQILTEGE